MASSHTSIILLKGDTFNAIAADSRESGPSLTIFSNNYQKILHVPDTGVFITFSGKSFIFDYIQNYLDIPPEVSPLPLLFVAKEIQRHVHRLLEGKLNGLNKQQVDKKLENFRTEIFLIDKSEAMRIFWEPVPTCPWHYGIGPITEQVFFLGSGTPNLQQFYNENFHPNMNASAAVEFLKDAVLAACMGNWPCGGDIHVVLAGDDYCREQIWQQSDTSYTYSWAPYHLMHDTGEPMS